MRKAAPAGPETHRRRHRPLPVAASAPEVIHQLFAAINEDGINITDLARKSGPTRESIYRWAAGHAPRIHDIAAIAQLFGLKLVLVPIKSPEPEAPAPAKKVRRVSDHSIQKIGEDRYRLSWVANRRRPGSMARFPARIHRDTDAAGAIRFAARWKVPIRAMDEPPHE